MSDVVKDRPIPAGLTDGNAPVEQVGEEILDSELQVYARRVSMICALEAGGKISALEAYRRIKHEWKQIKSLKREMFPKDKGLVS